MRLYHFTAAHHVSGGAGHAGPGIERDGLLPNPHPLISLPAMVWLTQDGAWTQVWSSRPVPGVDCDRTEVRLDLIVPKADRSRLLTYAQIRPFIRRDWLDDFEDGHDLSAWRGYLGRIPYSWVRNVATRTAVLT